jgi:hypothetical protein
MVTQSPERKKVADAAFAQTFMPYAIGGGLLVLPSAVGSLGFLPRDGFAPFLLLVACAVLIAGFIQGNRAAKRALEGRNG